MVPMRQITRIYLAYLLNFLIRLHFCLQHLRIMFLRYEILLRITFRLLLVQPLTIIHMHHQLYITAVPFFPHFFSQLFFLLLLLKTVVHFHNHLILFLFFLLLSKTVVHIHNHLILSPLPLTLYMTILPPLISLPSLHTLTISQLLLPYLLLSYLVHLFLHLFSRCLSFSRPL